MPKGMPMNTECVQMNDAELDRILSRNLSPEREIVPSSGFVTAVMEAVQREAAEPIPIPFPWSRALPGLVACLILTGWMIFRVAQVGVQVGSQTEIQTWRNSYLAWMVNSAAKLANLSTKLPSLLIQVFQQGVQTGAAWVLLALLFSWATVQFSLYLADS